MRVSNESNREPVQIFMSCRNLKLNALKDGIEWRNGVRLVSDQPQTRQPGDSASQTTERKLPTIQAKRCLMIRKR
jgi:hypothetical protein